MGEKSGLQETTDSFISLLSVASGQLFSDMFQVVSKEMIVASPLVPILSYGHCITPSLSTRKFRLDSAYFGVVVNM